MAYSPTKFYQLSEDLGKGVHNFTSDSTCTVKIALCAAANAPVVGNAVLADLTQISYTNLSGTRIVTGVTVEQTAGVAALTGDDHTLTASGGSVGPFRYAVLYNDDSASKSLMVFYDFGQDITINNGDSFILNIDTVILNITV